MSETPTYIGGSVDRGAPCYGEDNEYVLGELLGYDTKAIAKLAEDGVIPASAAKAIATKATVSAARVLEIERITGISRHVLRPDFYPPPEKD